ncbi:DUF2407 C-terminal domain containing protein [Rhypophila sp. PSN 637]
MSSGRIALDRNGGSSRSASSSPTDRNRLLPPSSSTSSALARPTSPSPLARSPPPLQIKVLFNDNRIKSMELEIAEPHKTPVVALKPQIRSRLAAQGQPQLPAEESSSSHGELPELRKLRESRELALKASKSRLKFYHAGKDLPDNSPLGSVLVSAPPPSSSASKAPAGKGKNVEGRDPAATPLVVHCNVVFDIVLSATELADEVRAAAIPAIEADSARSSPSPYGYGATITGRGAGLRLDTSRLRNNENGTSAGNSAPSGSGSRDAAASVPRGFDRYLAGGVSREDVLSMRQHFRRNVALRFTPETMPSPDTLLRMEDAWIDTNVPGTAGGGGGANDWGDTVDVGEVMPDDDDGSLAQVSDQLILGMMIGFFFPLGAIGWVLREPGMLAKRWQMFIILGIVLSVTMGACRVLLGGQDS